jgi:Flp pilus assembly pilin Flp
MRRGSRGHEGQSGQTLVEYALIIALIALASIVALGFLSGKINSLFSKAGNSVSNVTVAEGSGSPGGGGPVDPPPVAGTVAISCSGGTCYDAGTLTASLSGWSGATSFTYTWQQNSSSGEGCGGGGGWSGVGGNSPTLNGGSINVNGSQDAIRVTVVGHGNGPDTAPVCGSAVIVDAVPPSGSVNIDCPGSCNDGDTANAVTGTWSGVPTPTLTYQWAWNDSNGASCNGTAADGWVDLGTGPSQSIPNSTPGGSDVDQIRVIVTGTNIDGSATDRDCNSYS